MADCECLPKCPFFHDRMSNMPSMADIYKTRYCLGDNFHCARYKIFQSLGREYVPEDLFPNELERALEMLTERAPGVA